MGSPQKWLLLGLVSGLAVVRLSFGRKCSRPYVCFLSLCTFLFGYLVIFYDAWRLDTIPESRRYTLEFELFLILLLCELLRLMTASQEAAIRRAGWISAALMVAAGVPQAWDRFEQKYSEWGLRPREQTIEYRIAKWLDGRKPSGRVLASGGVRYRLNAWFDLPQVGGTFETGLRNRVPLDLAYEIRNDIGPRERTLDKLRALDVEYVVVHGRESEEHYRDFKNPERFDAMLERVWTGRDDAVYRVPGYTPRLVWSGPDRVRVESEEAPVNYDAGWRSESGGVRSTAQGFIRPAGPGADLRYHGTMEQKGMAAISAVVWLLALAALRKHR